MNSKTVFVIGNGTSVLKKELGYLIDQSDVVVRLNNWKTEGYEKFVGTKTDILFTSTLNNYLTNLSDFKEVILYLLMNPFNGVQIPESLINSPNVSKIITWDYVWKINPLLSLADNCYPSTGLAAILEMVKRFGKINIVGFDFFKDNNQHYFEYVDKPKSHRHDGDGAERIVKLLSYLHLITIH